MNSKLFDLEEQLTEMERRVVKIHPEVTIEIDEKIRRAKLQGSPGIGYDHIEALRKELHKALHDSIESSEHKLYSHVEGIELRHFQKAKEYTDQEVHKAKHYFELLNNKRLKEIEAAINELRVKLSETQGKVRKNTEHHTALAEDTR